ncbi:hypothetical protein [uncultured Acetatifactor sp.]|jgi:hypothetical protein|uniref:hypothetical protein n=1 Tax=uncultured Acetatifactor sp. TaxID=1671927 RepID=UPI0026187177|nr:hypothetical protein [uncultured Acetatifactor sp.]
MSSIRNYLLGYEKIWQHIRWVKRKADAVLSDKQHYFRIKRKTHQDFIDAERVIYERIDEITESIDHYAQLGISYNVDMNNLETVHQSQLEMYSNMGDQMGKVFSFRGEIYRGIVKESEEDFWRLWESGVLQGLAEQNIIPEVKIADFKTEEFSLVLHVEKIYIQKNTLWSYAMVLDACILIGILYSVLRKYDLTLCDGHLNNVTFDKGNPIFFDIGSIIPKRPTGAMEELTFGGLYRLLFGVLGNCMLYRLPSHDTENNNIYALPRFYNQYTRDYRYCLSKFKKLMLFRSGVRAYWIAHKLFDLFDVKPEYIKALFENRESNNEYDDLEGFYDLIDWDKIQGKSIIDTGGAYPILIKALQDKRSFKFIIFADFIEKRLDSIYKKFSFDEKVSFGLINYMYLHSNKQINQLKSDVVFCVNPCLNTGSFQGNNIQSIAYALNRIGEKYVIVLINLDKDQEINGNYEEFINSLCTYYEIEIRNMKSNRCIIGRRKQYGV